MTAISEKRWIFDASCGEVRPEGSLPTAQQSGDTCDLVAESVRDREDGWLIAAAPELQLALVAARDAIDKMTRGEQLTASDAYALGLTIQSALSRARGGHPNRSVPRG